METELGKRERPVDWSDLPADVVAHTFGRLTSFVDFVHCRTICPSWERALRGEARRLPAKKEDAPWLLLSVQAEQSHLADNNPDGGGGGHVTAIQVPGGNARRGRREICLGSCSGWLVMANDFGYARIVNPLTGASAPLPPLWKLPYVAGAIYSCDGRVSSFLYEDEHHCRQGQQGVPFSFDNFFDLVLLKAVIVDIGGGGATVAVLYRKERDFAVARTGQKSWTRVDNTELDIISDMTMHSDGKLYTLHLSGKVARWQIGGALRSPPTLLESKQVIGTSYGYVLKDKGDILEPWEDGNHFGQNSYLVGAPGGGSRTTTLYLIKRVYRYEQVGGRTERSTASFDVWSLYPSGGNMAWETSNGIIGAVAAFVSFTGSVCVPVPVPLPGEVGGGLQHGAVYFTEEAPDYLGAAMVEDFGMRKINVRQLLACLRSKEGRRRLRQRLRGKREMLSDVANNLGRSMNWPAPFWFMPSLQGLDQAPPAAKITKE